MIIRFFNTLSKKKEVFTPKDPSNIGMYLCGPTVYDFAHIGNARNVVLFDTLFRFLQRLYPTVTYVRNITDVDDKINLAAAKNKETIAELTQRTTKAYHEDMAALNTLSPTIEPRATHHINEMIEMIKSLIESGHAYEAEGHVLFSVNSFADYGKLSRRQLEDMIAGARVEIAPYKKDPADFVLWKPSDPETPGWESPWGRGRPGWHIECSAMSRRYLGEIFDIHGGGQDLIFPHHENEIAQSRCCYDTPVYATYWLHNGHLTVNGEKMSKSLGNFFTVRDLLSQYSGEVLRLGLMSTHYRQPLDWTEQTATQAKQTLDRFYGVLRQHPVYLKGTEEADSHVMDALADDLNIPLALTHLHDLTAQFYKEINTGTRHELATRLKASGVLLGILQQDPSAWFHGQQAPIEDGFTAEYIESMIQRRKDARHEKNFAESDRIRDHLLHHGIILEDGPTGTTWRRL